MGTVSSDEVARHVCRLEVERGRRDAADVLDFWRRQLSSVAKRWRLVEVTLDAVAGRHGHKSDSEYPVSWYIERRRGGSPFPAIVLRRPWGADRRWIVWDGNHRVRAAELCGDRTIAAYVPATAPPTRRSRDVEAIGG